MEDNRLPQLSQERTNAYRNTPYVFSFDSTRTFFCNAINFLNSGTSTVFINDIWELAAGATLDIGSNQNEVDLTIYKLQFRGAGTNKLQVWIKEDAGNNIYQKYPRNSFYLKDVDKRITDKKRNGVGARKGQNDGKVNAKMRGDF